jgi:hypothetical protein
MHIHIGAGCACGGRGSLTISVALTPSKTIYPCACLTPWTQRLVTKKKFNFFQKSALQ